MLVMGANWASQRVIIPIFGRQLNWLSRESKWALDSLDRVGGCFARGQVACRRLHRRLPSIVPLADSLLHVSRVLAHI